MFRICYYAAYRFRWAAFFLLMLSFSGLHGFYVKNQTPFFKIFGVPKAESAQIFDGQEFSVVSDVTYNRVLRTTEKNVLFLKGETFTFNFVYSRKFRDNWSFGVEIPYVLVRATNMGNFINNYHSLLGLTDKDISGMDAPSYYIFLPDGEFLCSGEDEAFGDMLLRVKNNFYQSDNFFASWLAYIKLPTGKKDVLTGSGNGDFSVALSCSHLLGKFVFDYFCSGSYLGEFCPLKEYQRKFVYTADLGVDYLVTEKISARVQFNGSTAYYKNTGFDSFDEGSLQILAGAKYLMERWEFRFFVGEDLIVSHSPDVSFSFSTIYRF